MANFRSTFALLAITTLGVACSSDDDGPGGGPDGGTGSSPPAASDGTLRASVRRTPGGVPHIAGDDLASVAFGAGFVQAEDHVCLIAEAVVKARGERALFFGPGDGNANVLSDFSRRALAIGDDWAAATDALSPDSRALLDGFAAGYNRYLADTPPGELPAACREQPWVRSISSADLYAHYRVVAQSASGGLFASGALIAAVPPGQSPVPSVVDAVDPAPGRTPGNAPEKSADRAEHVLPDTIDPREIAADAERAASSRRDFVDIGFGSNAWGIGRELSENGRGALLANPHFPYTGPRRFYQMHLSVTDDYDVNGAGLIGLPIPLIGFNRHVAWSHTVSTARRFTLYELTLADGDAMAYVKDGETVPIRTETIRVEVGGGDAAPVTLERDVYFSEHGPMLAADLVTGGALPAWGANGTAYTFRDANARAATLLDTWLGLGRATTLDAFRAVYEDECGSNLWTNTVYADDAGNAYYIDGSSVPRLSDAALAALDAKRAASEDFATLFEQGLTLLDGSTSRDDWVEGECNGRVPHAGRPELLRGDFVQNSNSSHWQSNPAAPLTGVSPLFGREAPPLNARTRLGLRMLQSPTLPGFAPSAPAGQDGRFGARELLEVIWNDRTLYAELVLPELRERCTAIGTGAVSLPRGGSRPVDGGCAVLAGWDGLHDIDSVGAHVFRVFLGQAFARTAPAFQIDFDPIDAGGATASFVADGRGTAEDPLLQSLASGLEQLDASGIAYDATLGSVQRWTPSGGAAPGGTPVRLADPIPWHGGGGELDGAFNAVEVVASPVLEDTLFPRLSSPTRPDTGGLSTVAGEGWAIARGTSWHFGLAFTDTGPEAYGLLGYAQSGDPDSPFFIDQSLAYSAREPRRLLYDEADIAANVLPGGTRVLEGVLPGR